MKDQLVFDTTDVTSIAHSDSVGAYIRSSDGTLITHTNVGGKDALDVNIVEGVNVEVDLDAADDSVAAWLSDGSGNAISSTGGALHISDAGGSLTVDATDLDIRDLSGSTDSVNLNDGTNSLVINADGSLNIADNGGSITVDASDLDIRDLTSASDSIQSHLYDGAGTALTSTLVGADQALDVNVVNDVNVNDAALANTAIANAANTLSVADTAQDLVSSPLSDRKYLFVRNQDNKRIYIGSTGVTAANGFPLSPGSVLSLRAGASVDIEFVGSSGATPEVRTLELS